MNSLLSADDRYALGPIGYLVLDVVLDDTPTGEFVVIAPEWNPGEDAPTYPTRAAALAAAWADSKAT